jgi:hypothetical protein
MQTTLQAFIDPYWTDYYYDSSDGKVKLFSSGATQLTGSFLFLTPDAGTGVCSVTLLDAQNLILASTTGTKFGTAVTQKLAFYGATPIVQRANSMQKEIADNTGGTAADVLVNCTAVYDESKIENNFATLCERVNELRNALYALGLIKGDA